MNEILTWYQAREPREKALILAAAAVLIFTLLFFSVVRPMIKQYQYMERDLSKLKKEMPWYRKTVATILRNQSSGQSIQVRSTQSIQTLINQSARQAGIGRSINRIEPRSEDEAQVSLRGAAFNNVLVWIERLEQSHRLAVNKVSFKKTKTPGLIDARITFKRN